MADSKMTFDKYIDNPSGGSVFTNRNIRLFSILVKYVSYI